MKQISDLVADIYATINQSDIRVFNDEWSINLGKDISTKLALQLGEGSRKGTLRLSKMGPTCPCALWHSVHAPGLAEPLPAHVKIKFAYGHVLEALVIALAKAAGHTVEGEQDELILDGVTGHRDCILDGCIVDVKSASSRSFQKFRDGSIKDEDHFGYLDQLDAYLVSSLEDPRVLVKDKAYLLAIDKTLGHLALYEHNLREQHIRNRVADYKRIVELSNPPKCLCGTELDGKSGNIKLDVKASYSSFKYICHPNLRTFIYANGPKYLVRVNRLPEVIEVDKFGKVLHSGRHLL